MMKKNSIFYFVNRKLLRSTLFPEDTHSPIESSKVWKIYIIFYFSLHSFTVDVLLLLQISFYKIIIFIFEHKFKVAAQVAEKILFRKLKRFLFILLLRIGLRHLENFSAKISGLRGRREEFE